MFSDFSHFTDLGAARAAASLGPALLTGLSGECRESVPRSASANE
jgi:hypothetical protein